MEYAEKEFLLNKIIAGITICYVGGVRYVVRSPTAEQRYFAELIYLDTLKKAEFQHAYSDEHIHEWMIMKGFWSKEEDEKLKKADEAIEELKVEIYNKFYDETLPDLRKSIKRCRHLHEQLFARKHDYSNLTCRGIAFSVKQKYLIGSSIFINNTPYWTDLDDWEKPDNLLDNIISVARNQEISEEKVREISRFDTWRSMWASRDGCKGVFNKYVTELTPEQSRLILYSKMYDRIYEYHERPPEEIINDDDALDGWKILQRRKTEKEAEKKKVEEKVGKIPDAKEVYIMASNDKELKIINEMNDLNARMAKLSREKQIKEQGKVEVANFVDVRMDLLEQLRKS